MDSAPLHPDHADHSDSERRDLTECEPLELGLDPLPSSDSASCHQGDLRNQVAIGAPREDGTYSYGLVLRHPGNGSLLTFRVEHELPEGLDLVETQPPGQVDGPRVIWEGEDFGDGESREFHLIARPTEGEQRDISPTAEFHIALRSRPGLTIALDAPATVMVGQMATFRLRVTNQGKRRRKGVVLACRVTPESNEAKLKTFRAEAGLLEPGESKSIAVQVVVTHAGRWTAQAWERGEGNSRSLATAVTEGCAPALSLRAEAPKECHPNEPFGLELELANEGTAAARDISLTLELPADVHADLSASDDHHLKENSISWQIEQLPPEHKKNIRLMMCSKFPGELRFHAEAHSSFGDRLAQPVSLPCRIPQQASLSRIDEILSIIEAQYPTETQNDDLPALLPETSETPSERHLIVTLGDRVFSIPLASLKEVSRLIRVTRLPVRVPWLLGVTNVRGDILSVVDLRKLLGFPTTQATDQMIIVRDSTRTQAVCFMVDEVIGLRLIPIPTPVNPAVPPRAKVERFLGGISQYEGADVAVFDVDRLLTCPELTSLNEANHYSIGGTPDAIPQHSR